MNNGQSSQDNIYFTPGVGNLPASQNQEVIPNLNIDESAWKQPERDPRDIGGNVISSMEATITDQSPSQEPKMGEVVSLEPAKPSEPISDAALANVDVGAIRTEGDHLAKGALPEVYKAETELSQTGNASNFYRTARGMMEANLNSSYNRKLAA